MRDFLTLGSTPIDEPCTQVGEPDYPTLSRKECRKFIRFLRRRFGHEPKHAQLVTKEFQHDFGLYREVVVFYDDEDKESEKYALFLEGNIPLKWDEALHMPEFCPACKIQDGAKSELFWQPREEGEEQAVHCERCDIYIFTGDGTLVG